MLFCEFCIWHADSDGMQVFIIKALIFLGAK